MKERFFTQFEQLQAADRFVIISYLLNHTSYEIRRGKDEFIEASFDLIRFGVDREIFIIDGVFDAVHFLNAIEVSSRLQKYDWAHDLIAKWSDRLPTETKDYYISLGLALIHFKKKGLRCLLRYAGENRPQRATG